MTTKNGSPAPYQPQPSGGLFGGFFGFFSRLFGGSTPSYQGNGQPPPTGSGLFGSFFSGTPVYKTAATQAPTPTTTACDPSSPKDQTSTEPTSGTAPEGQSKPLMIVITRD